MLRIKEPVALWDATIGAHVVPRPDELFAADDPLVRQHRWAFATEGELAKLAEDRKRVVESVPVEQATRAPGERRNVRRS